MKRLLIMRHAKSAWSQPGLDDHERPLNARGERDAPRMGRWLRDAGYTPDLALCSDAVRAMATWDGARAELDDVPTIVRPDFYHADQRAITDALTSSLPGLREAQTVIVVGHNPGWSDAVGWFSGYDVSLTTANVAVLEHAGESWVDAVCEPGAWMLVTVARPRELPTE